ncbi:Ku protein [Streptomyces sp. NPDC047315]|uniref:non-homologous end joining protein Ku n=1 Tax=Streptomyces sp. NPDC047315 TaxID=3155142 RepID=UPI00340692E6
MRATWKGAISFGLVTIPVQLFTATEEHDLPLRQVHVQDGSRVRMRRFCEAEDKEIPYAEVARGYEAPDGSMITLTDEDLADLPLPSKKVIDVLAFVDAEAIDPLMLSKAYYVGSTDRSAAKPYALLRDALAQAGQIAVTKIALRSREALAVLRVRDDTLVLQTCLWPDEVRPAAGIAPEGEAAIRPQELKMARSLMDTLSEDFDLDSLHDEYQEALRLVVEAKLQGVEPPHEAEAAPNGGKVIDLMAALESSVRAAKESRGEEAGAEAGEEAEVRKLPARKPAKKAAAKKTTGKTAAKTTAAKTAEKKAAPRKSTRKTAQTAQKAQRAQKAQKTASGKSTKRASA